MLSPIGLKKFINEPKFEFSLGKTKCSIYVNISKMYFYFRKSENEVIFLK